MDYEEKIGRNEKKGKEIGKENVEIERIGKVEKEKEKNRWRKKWLRWNRKVEDKKVKKEKMYKVNDIRRIERIEINEEKVLKEKRKIVKEVSLRKEEIRVIEVKKDNKKGNENMWMKGSVEMKMRMEKVERGRMVERKIRIKFWKGWNKIMRKEIEMWGKEKEVKMKSSLIINRVLKGKSKDIKDNKEKKRKKIGKVNKGRGRSD